MRNQERVADIFLTMCKIGTFTFGGGWSIIGQMQAEFVSRRGWLTDEQVADYMSLAKSFPGVMIVNMSVYCGYAMAGVTGAVAAAFGLCAPAILAIAVVTYFYASLRDNIIVAKILSGIRSVVVPIIIGASLNMRRAALKGGRSFWIMLASFAVCAFTAVSKPIVVIAALFAGLALWHGVIPEEGGEKS